MRTMKNLALAAFAAAALALAGCGGGGSPSTAGSEERSPYETAKAAIMTAETAEAAQKAYDDVKDDVTAAQGDMLQKAVNDRSAALATMAREMEQKDDLMDAAGMVVTDASELSTQALVDAAKAANVALRQALDDADDVSEADKAKYQDMLDDAIAAVDEAQGGIDTATRRTNQMGALSDRSSELRTALRALVGVIPTQEQIDTANNAHTALNTAITEATDLTEPEKAVARSLASDAVGAIGTAQTARNNANDNADNADKIAMAATAAKLYAGISAQMGTVGTATDGDRAAAYSGTNDADITVTFDSDPETGNTEQTQVLKATKMTVADNHGWEGKQYMASGTGVSGTYEALVYSNVGEPTMGLPFGGTSTQQSAGEVQYTLTNGATSVSTTADGVPARVVSSSFDQSAGVKRFPLPSPNPNEATVVTVNGSYHGVSGTYSCTPGDTAVCAVQVAANGFNLGTVPSGTDATFTNAGGSWMFKPDDPKARVTETPDSIYASYGWWLHKSADDKTYTASAFVDNKGTVPAASGITALQGTAKYMGGAAGKYALSSSTGGTNDAGHFTARATLEADFGDDMITGMIDMFVGADGESRDWSVELMEQGVGDTGTILGDNGTGTAKMTKWTIGGTTADASGEWRGTLYDNDSSDNDVPKVGTGTFYSTFGSVGGDGKMVGASGVNKQ